MIFPIECIGNVLLSSYPEPSSVVEFSICERWRVLVGVFDISI